MNGYSLIWTAEQMYCQLNWLYLDTMDQEDEESDSEGESDSDSDVSDGTKNDIHRNRMRVHLSRYGLEFLS